MTGIAQCKLSPRSNVKYWRLGNFCCLCAFICPLLTRANVYRTFLKRKGGLFKKAHELSVLCSVDVAVFIFGQNKKLYEYSSADMRELMAKHHYVRFHTPEMELWESSC